MNKEFLPTELKDQLIHASEEACELATNACNLSKALLKAARFGMFQNNPLDPNHVNNWTDILNEYDDLNKALHAVWKRFPNMPDNPIKYE